MKPLASHVTIEDYCENYNELYDIVRKKYHPPIVWVQPPPPEMHCWFCTEDFTGRPWSEYGIHYSHHARLYEGFSDPKGERWDGQAGIFFNFYINPGRLGDISWLKDLYLERVNKRKAESSARSNSRKKARSEAAIIQESLEVDTAGCAWMIPPWVPDPSERVVRKKGTHHKPLFTCNPFTPVAPTHFIVNNVSCAIELFEENGASE